MDATTAQGVAARERPKLKVFVSYSRRDLPFVERLVAALDSRDIDVVIDRRNLPLAVEFQKELLGFIRQADAVVYVVSSASTGSLLGDRAGSTSQQAARSGLLRRSGRGRIHARRAEDDGGAVGRTSATVGG
jgi:hypothetical protein